MPYVLHHFSFSPVISRVLVLRCGSAVLNFSDFICHLSDVVLPEASEIRSRPRRSMLQKGETSKKASPADVPDRPLLEDE